jgi:hypothetical protein
VVPAQDAPHRLDLASGALWEFPVAVWRSGARRVPVGGASYWALMPTRLVLRGLDSVGAYGGLYLHPYELDPEPLRPHLPTGVPLRNRAHGALRAAQRNLARRHAPGVLRAIAERYRLIPYGEAHAVLSGRLPARPGRTAARSQAL